MTKEIIAAAKPLGIVHDHITIGSMGHSSFKHCDLYRGDGADQLRRVCVHRPRYLYEFHDI